jgi:hypothetical protein
MSVARGEFAEAWLWSDAPVEEDAKLKSDSHGLGDNSKVVKVNGSHPQAQAGEDGVLRYRSVTTIPEARPWNGARR